MFDKVFFQCKKETQKFTFQQKLRKNIYKGSYDWELVYEYADVSIQLSILSESSVCLSNVCANTLTYTCVCVCGWLGACFNSHSSWWLTLFIFIYFLESERDKKSSICHILFFPLLTINQYTILSSQGIMRMLGIHTIPTLASIFYLHVTEREREKKC